MAQRVPRTANAVMRFGIPAAALLAVAGVAAPMIWVRAPAGTGRYRAPEQPVPFDHDHHVRRSGIDCLFCHTDAQNGPSAGIPATEVCMGCHRQVWKDAPVLAPVRKSWETGTPIEWRRVNALPMFVFFDHSIHLRAGIGCSSCHGQVGFMPRVAQMEPLTMGWCLDCHRNPLPHVRPRSELTNPVWRPQIDPESEALRRELVAKNQVRSLTFCSTCHR